MKRGFWVVVAAAGVCALAAQDIKLRVTKQAAPPDFDM